MTRLWLLVWLITINTGLAQINQPQRYEIPLGKTHNNFKVVACNSEGLLLWTINEFPAAGDSSLFILAALDTAFNLKWQKSFFINSSLLFIGQKYHKGKAYLLFGDYIDNKRHLQLVDVSIEDGAVAERTIKNIIPFSFFGMEIVDNAIVIGGYFNYRPLVLLYNFEERIPRILPGLFNDRSELVQLNVNKNNNIDIITRGRNAEKINTLFINTFDSQARLIKKVELRATRRKALLFGRSKNLSGPSQIVAGVYGKKNSDYSRGVFIANVNQFGEQQIKYYNYAEFKNFFSYMRAKREARIKRRIERKKIKNKRIRFNYRLIVHDLIEDNGQYILLGEAFYPTYTSVQNSPGMFNPMWSVNRGSFSYNRVFDGYQYTHAVVIGFDKEGNVLWDNSFEIKDVKSMYLEQFVHTSIRDKEISMLYVFDNAIRSKVIRGNEVLEGKEVIDIKLNNAEDVVNKNDTRIDGLVRWYGDVFVTYGRQTVRSVHQSGISIGREVFFVNKIVPK